MNLAEFQAIINESLGAEAGARLCSLICQRAAGETLYIPKRPPVPEIAPSDTPAVIAKRYQISRPTAYRWVDRWRR